MGLLKRFQQTYDFHLSYRPTVSFPSMKEMDSVFYTFLSYRCLPYLKIITSCNVVLLHMTCI